MSDANKEKLPYATPKLLVHGTAAEITQAPPFTCDTWPGRGRVPPPFDCTGSGDNVIWIPPGHR